MGPEYEHEYGLLPAFPIDRAEGIQLFEIECSTDEDVLHQLVSVSLVCFSVTLVLSISLPQVHKLRHSEHSDDANRFLRGNLREMFTDEAARPYSWFGQRGNIAISKFVLMRTLMGE